MTSFSQADRKSEHRPADPLYGGVGKTMILNGTTTTNLKGKNSMKNINISVDTGNKMMKTPHFVFPAGLTNHYGQEPVNVVDVEYIRCGKNYYTISEQHIPNVQDKSSDDSYNVLLMIAMAKELSVIGLDNLKDTDGVVRVTISLAVGLPIQHYKALTPTYMRNYRNGGAPYVFAYKPLGGKLTKYEITVSKVRVFPQGFAAAQSNADVKAIVRDGNAVIIDIGGYTTDMCRMKNGAPTSTANRTFNSLGMNALYRDIANLLENALFVRFSDEAIDQILDPSKKTENLPKRILEDCREMPRDYAKRLVNTIIFEEQVDFYTNKLIFVGGGSLRLRDYIEEAVKARGGKAYFIEDIKANAIGYQSLAADFARIGK